MQAMDIANEALDSVLGKYKAALKISLPIMVLNIGLIALLSYDFWQAVFFDNQFGAEVILSGSFGTVRVILIPLFLTIISFYWVTVAWHRFIILDEPLRGVFPKLHLKSIWAYMWRLFVLALALGFVVGVPLLLLSSAVGGGGQLEIGGYSKALQRGPLDVIINMIGTAVFTYAFLRYSPLLVAAAIGQPIRPASGWESTYWARSAIALLAIGYAVVSLIYPLVGGGLSTGIWQVDLVIFLGLQWVGFMFTISLLTTLYQKSVVNYSEAGQTDYIKN